MIYTVIFGARKLGKMKKIALVILLFATALASFARQAKKKKLCKKDIVSVSIHRTVCFGQCPEYEVAINRDGTVTYTAKRFTPDTGIFEKKISKEEAGQIMDMIVQYRVDTCTEMYENRIPDLPGLNYTITYRRKKRVQKIFNSSFGPHYLLQIAEAMEAIGKKPENAGTEWKKTGMPKMQ